MAILLTGGAGFIGSHTSVELIKAGYDVVLVDDFSNSSPEVLNRLKTITGKEIPFFQGSILDKDFLTQVFQENDIEAVIHFAAFKAVGESVAQPLKYYHNNITGTISLLEVMQEQGVKKIVFSSSATVYGMNNVSPLTEDLPTSATNPYGYTKVMMEQILMDLAKADADWSVTLLRYFNPIGAHESGLIGEAPNGIPNNLMPYITQVAVGKLAELSVFGDDYDTADGTGVRDYIHVVDLANGHALALKHNLTEKGTHIFNLGTGNGYSVLDLVKAFEAENKVAVPYVIKERRPGDIATCYADASKAKEVLGWTAQKDLHDMMRDSWKWQSQNPNGYDK
ncbi:UDP-glucose 4-epimerase GalE [Streptococcus loxodontisalivarius]|uniref:UDP-glucose 4-epimerase n=1 Tax=Streptococcus loxodontisalivarius TaxID=1349415 RepID=A0ABS2PSE3_9STRE|nr:UDP-glucose 4-epimerase GalE [Streptococcus loxodontisalivarius]MBM7642961.1 UDP-glucose 4-epimerase [Streptococcus loxodontisalivarius]